jgi:hypothetical protein
MSNIITLQEAFIGYIIFTLICAIPLRVSGETWVRSLTSAAVIPLVVLCLWGFVTLVFAYN